MLTELLRGGWLQGLPYRLGLYAATEDAANEPCGGTQTDQAQADHPQHPTTRDFILMAQAARRAASQ
ncbi:hypothetical protein [Methylobacterium nigriterrae]|uniref:hypothetical protein n=1 Tax=Methylobacterium nigriterrae TaxID=3127512 RepID=UPI0030141CBA